MHVGIHAGSCVCSQGVFFSPLLSVDNVCLDTQICASYLLLCLSPWTLMDIFPSPTLSSPPCHLYSLQQQEENSCMSFLLLLAPS